MRKFCQDAISQLNNAPNWGTQWVELRMEFWRRYGNGMIFSTQLGIEFFAQLLRCLDGEEWTTKDEKGEYGDNFRKLINAGRKE